MRDDVALCAHLAGAALGPAPFALALDEVLDWYDGVVVAVVRCRRCGARAWLELLDWDPRAPVRVFGLAALRAADAALFFRDRARGSCDVGRLAAEREALAASAGRFERVVALDGWPEPRITAAVAAEAGLRAPGGASLERLGELADGPWLARLGLPSGARS